MNIAIITACPSGVANSMISAGLLEQAAKDLNWTAHVECQSTVIPPSPLTQQQIDAAEVIVIAANTPVDTQRFVGKKSTKVISQTVSPRPKFGYKMRSNKRAN